MGTAITVIIILLVIVAVIALVAMSAYNGFVKSRNLIQESWRQVDVELNRRYELIPNLVETVRAYAAHERNTLEDITRLRSQAQQLSQSEGGLPSQQRADVEAELSGAVRNLIVSVEAYPDLKSNTNFLELQRQLAETEDRIANGRRYYNANVRVYNTKVESVPTNIIANVFKFEKATYFEVNDPAVRQAPNVSFGEIAYRGDQQHRRRRPRVSCRSRALRGTTTCRTRSSSTRRPRSSTDSPSSTRRSSTSPQQGQQPPQQPRSSRRSRLAAAAAAATAALGPAAALRAASARRQPRPGRATSPQTTRHRSRAISPVRRRRGRSSPVARRVATSRPRPSDRELTCDLPTARTVGTHGVGGGPGVQQLRGADGRRGRADRRRRGHRRRHHPVRHR